MTFSAHTLSIKLLTLHMHTLTNTQLTRTHTHTEIHNWMQRVEISAVGDTGALIVFMGFSLWISCQVRSRSRCTCHLQNDALLHSIIHYPGRSYHFIISMTPFVWVVVPYLSKIKALIVDDVEWLTSLYTHRIPHCWPVPCCNTVTHTPEEELFGKHQLQHETML